MLVPVYSFKDELELLYNNTLYDMDYMYYHGSTQRGRLDVDEVSENVDQFVSINGDNDILGYISYRTDWQSRSVDNLGILSFDKGNMLFIKDVYRCIDDLFKVHNMNRLEFFCYTDNPAIRGYRNFIKRFGGKEIAYFRDVALLLDGKLHDAVIFEIMSADRTNDKLPKHILPAGISSEKYNEISQFVRKKVEHCAKACSQSSHESLVYGRSDIEIAELRGVRQLLDILQIELGE